MPKCPVINHSPACPPVKQWPQEGSNAVGFDPAGWERGPHSPSARWLAGPGDIEREAGGLRPRGARGGGKDPFQGSADSRYGKEGTEGVGVSHSKGTGWHRP